MSTLEYLNASPHYGCSPEEIAEIEHIQGAQCPEAYAAVLARVGKVIGRLQEGEYWSYPETLEFKRELLDLQADLDTPIAVPEDALVVAVYLGAQFMFVRASESSDPPIMRCGEGETMPVVAYNSVTEFLGRALPRLINPTGRESESLFLPYRVEGGIRKPI